MFAEPLLERPLDVLRRDRIAVDAPTTLGDHDEIETATDRSSRHQGTAHRLFPVVRVGWTLWDQHPVGTCGEAVDQRQVATVASHHLDDHGALVARRGAVDRIDRLSDAMQGRIGPDGHVGAKHVIVDRTDQPHEGEPALRFGGGSIDLAHLGQLGEQLRPLLAKRLASVGCRRRR